MELQRLDPVALKRKIAYPNGYPEYNTNGLSLIDAVLAFLTNVVQDELCLSNQRVTQSLRDLLCRTSLVYEPVPSVERMVGLNEEVKKQTMTSRGGYGMVYTWNALDEAVPVILKSPIVFSTITIREMYVNYVLINGILLRDRLTHNLVATYGFFLSPADVEENDGLRLAFHSKPRAKPLFHMIQQRVDGMTLRKYYKTPGFNLEKCKSIIQKVWRVLIALEASPYRLYHNDLHLDNIMVSSDESVVLIDWGFASFVSSEGEFYKSPNTAYSPSSFVSATNDAYLFLRSFIGLLSDNDDYGEMFTYITEVNTRLFSNFYHEKDMDAYLLPLLEKKRVRDEKLNKYYDTERDYQEYYNYNRSYYETKLEALRKTLELSSMEDNFYSGDEDEDEEDEKSEAPLNKNAIQWVSEGVFTPLDCSDSVFGYRLRNKLGYEMGVPYLVHQGRDQNGVLFEKGRRYTTLYSFLTELEKYTSSNERREQLHALHMVKLDQLTHAKLASLLFDMTEADIKEAQGQCDASVMEKQLGKKSKRKRRGNKRTVRKSRK